MTNKKDIDFGYMKKGGINPESSIPRPTRKPPAPQLKSNEITLAIVRIIKSKNYDEAVLEPPDDDLYVEFIQSWQKKNLSIKNLP